MQRKIIDTADGSSTLYVNSLGEHYHSVHGAVTESRHIYINAGFNHCKAKNIRVLEFGLGTGLNILLTLQEADRRAVRTYYHAIEKYPLEKTEWEALNFASVLTNEWTDDFKQIHKADWGEEVHIRNDFALYKEHADFREASPGRSFDVIYFDAFSPDIQPDLWTEEMFSMIFNIASPGAVLTTYSSKGHVKRSLVKAGFSIEKIPGPPGKREFIRAIKIN